MCQGRMAVWANGEKCIPLEKINDAIQANNTEQLKKWRTEIDRNKKGNLSQIHPTVCQTLDKLFRNYFIEKKKKDSVVVSANFMGSTDGARSAWREYYEEVMTTFQNAQSNEHLPLGFTARAALDLYWIANSKQPLPFLTMGVIEAFMAVLFPVKDALIEVSILFSYAGNNTSTQKRAAHRIITMRGNTCHLLCGNICHLMWTAHRTITMRGNICHQMRAAHRTIAMRGNVERIECLLLT